MLSAVIPSFGMCVDALLSYNPFISFNYGLLNAHFNL